MAIWIEQWYNTIIKLIERDHTKDYRDKIHDILTSREGTKIPRSFSSSIEEADLVINANGKSVSLSNFFKEKYSIHHHVKPWWQFLHNIEWPYIFYQPECIDTIWFRLSIFHEWAHAKNYEYEKRNNMTFTKDSAAIHNEKKAWTDWYSMINTFQSTHWIDLLSEFSSISCICKYANMHILLSLQPKLHIKNIKNLILREDQFV